MSEEVPGQEGMRKVLGHYIYIETWDIGMIHLKINANEETCDSAGRFDAGLILAIADEFSSIGSPMLCKKDGQYFYNTMNLKKVSFKPLKMGETYSIIMQVREHEGLQLLYEIKVLDRLGDVIELILHLKKRSGIKF